MATPSPSTAPVTPPLPSDLTSSLSPTPPSLPSSVSLTPNHIAALIPTKLENGNYLLWKNLITPILQNFDLYSLFDGTEPCPPSTLPSNEPNPDYSQWIYKDRTCTILLHVVLSTSILPFVVGAGSAKQLCDNLERRFAAFSRSHILQLKNELYNIKKGSLKMAAYLGKFTAVSDNLAAAGAPLDDLDHVAHVLRGLPSDYNSFGTSIRVRAEPITPAALHNLLLSEEIELQHQETFFTPPLSTPTFQAFSTAHRPKYNPKHNSGPTYPKNSYNPPLLRTPPLTIFRVQIGGGRSCQVPVMKGVVDGGEGDEGIEFLLWFG